MSVARQRPVGGRHQEILEAAVRVITERGLSETRISDIAERCGVSPGLILYYFDSKDRLLGEALTFANDRFYLRTSREVRRLPRAADRLARLIELSTPGYLPGEEPLDEWALWLEIWVRALRDPELAREREVLDRRWRQSIEEIIRQGQETGEFPPGDAHEQALRIGAFVDGMAIQVLLRDSEVSPKHMRDACLEMAAREIGYELEPAGG